MTVQTDGTGATATQVRGVTDLAQAYFELLYTGDTALFDQVFHDESALLTVQDGRLARLSANDYRALLAGRESPRALGAPREDAIISIDFSSATHALLKVRVRIDQAVFIDHLSVLHLASGWRIVSKTYFRLPA
jgi:hypothetical protein